MMSAMMTAAVVMIASLLTTATNAGYGGIIPPYHRYRSDFYYTTTTTTTTASPPTSSSTVRPPFNGSFIEGRAKCLGCFASKLGCDWMRPAVAETAVLNLPTPTLKTKDDAGCASLCLVNTQCTHYTFSSMAPGLGFCFLKNSSSSLIPTAALAPFNAAGSTCGWMFGRSEQQV